MAPQRTWAVAKRISPKGANFQIHPSLPVAEAIADTFNVSLDYLASGEKTKTITAKNLKDDQIQLITELVQEIAKPSGRGRRLSARQQDLMARLIEQFLR